MPCSFAIFVSCFSHAWTIKMPDTFAILSIFWPYLANFWLCFTYFLFIFFNAWRSDYSYIMHWPGHIVSWTVIFLEILLEKLFWFIFPISFHQIWILAGMCMSMTNNFILWQQLCVTIMRRKRYLIMRDTWKIFLALPDMHYLDLVDGWKSSVRSLAPRWKIPF